MRQDESSLGMSSDEYKVEYIERILSDLETLRSNVCGNYQEAKEKASDEELAAIVRNKQERVAQAKGTSIPLLLDPKRVLNFIDIWHQDPNTPIDDDTTMDEIINLMKEINKNI